MIYAQKDKKIRIMFTPFRDGLQSAFDGKVRLQDFLPAMRAAVDAGVRHIEFGGGDRYRTPLVHLGENPFDVMRSMRQTVGPDVDLQILTRSISGVTRNIQNLDILEMQARLLKQGGATWNRNYDYLNDVGNLVKTGRIIARSGMHHQVAIALMGLPFPSPQVHTAEYYTGIGRLLLASDMRIDSLCLKDASGTTDPAIVYETASALKKIMPPGMPLWLHTHDTAGIASACYLAGIQGGVDGIDVSIRPLANGTVQPDVRSIGRALRGTGYSLDVDLEKMCEVEQLLARGLENYDFNPLTMAANARVLSFPMSGSSIAPNFQMMVNAGIAHKYEEVLAEFPVVFHAGGGWASVSPGSQQYWLQAFYNILYGRWFKIDPGYGRAMLGYFGKTPLAPDPRVLAKASQQLGLPAYQDDPFEAAPDNIPHARRALEERKLSITEENIFMVLSTMEPGKRMEMNEGILFLTGKSQIEIPWKKKNGEGTGAPIPSFRQIQPIAGPVSSRCTVVENGKSRTFVVTLERDAQSADATPAAASTPSVRATAADRDDSEILVHSPFPGAVHVSEILVAPGAAVEEGQNVVTIEAMKAKYDIKSPCDGVVDSVCVKAGDEVDSHRPLLVLKKKAK